MFLFGAAGAGTAGTGNLLTALLPWILMFVIFYFLLIRPQQQQQKRRKQMLNELKRGDKIVTVGGIHGEVNAVDGDDLRVRIAEKLEVQMTRSGIARVKGSDDGES